MSLTRVIACTLLVSAPLLGRAQATPGTPSPTDPTPAPAHRWYAGVGMYTSSHERAGARPQQSVAVPLQLTLGYHLRPRLALQMGAVTAGTRVAWADVVRQPDGTLRPTSGSYRERSTSLSAQGRYGLTRTPAHRLQVDVLSGVTVRRFTARLTRTYPDSSTATGSAARDDRARATNNALLTAGASARYRLGTHLEAVADGTVSVPLSPRRAFGTPALALGLRYRFTPGAR